MNRHITTEILSAYLDSELGVEAAERIEFHCESCADCRARLLAIRRVSRSLASLASMAPPAALRAQIRRRVESEPLRQRWLARLRWLFEVPARPVWRNTAAAAFALVASTFLLNQGLRWNQGASFPAPQLAGEGIKSVKVVTYLGDTPFPDLKTTGEVAGVEFEWTKETGWFQKGLEGERPAAQFDVTSPIGRELVRRFSDLLVEGDSVVLRYNLETVELRAEKKGLQSTKGLTKPRIRAGLDLQARFV